MDEGKYINEETKKDIKEMIEILKALDYKSLLILDSGARILKARMDMDIQNSNDRKTA